MKSIVAVLVLGLALAVPCYGQVQRLLPKNAQRGTLGARQPAPLVDIDGNILRLAPGARIVDQNNRSIVQGRLPSGADVLYRKNRNDQVSQIYILTPREEAALDRAGR
ncbi:MAG TPA: hypothetical protein VFM11_13645 [Burkholderiales bacterium]|nr:hypothetical protein [Burkholderiales bacterium]